jgi:hypothetical protein
MNSTELLSRAISILKDEGFVPYGAVKLGKRPKGLLLHEAIRKVIGMKPDDSVYMYWNWEELHKSLNALWLDLDDASTRVADRKTSVVALMFEESTKFGQVENIVATFEANHTKSFAYSEVKRRPAKSESSVRFVGKMMGALLATIGLIEEARSSGFGDLLSSLTEVARTDEELLVHLDELCAELGAVDELVAPKSVVILRAIGNGFEKLNKQREDDGLEQLTLSEFFIETEESANWAGLTDQVILRRLLAISPETADAQLKAIDKFLSE